MTKYLQPQTVSPNGHTMLNIGCGYRFHRDWTNIDLNPSSPHVINYNILQGLPFEDNTFDVVYHSHILEHLKPEAGRSLLLECHRVLKLNGILRVVVPDLAYSCRLYLESLEAVNQEPKSEIAHEHYTWSVLNLIDQFVRTESGGEIKHFIQDTQLKDVEFIIRSGGGAEIATMHQRSKNNVSTKVESSIFKRLSRVTPSRLWNRIKSGLIRRWASDSIKEFIFRRSGEIHQWMYDEYSLTQALRNLGFTNVQVMDDHSSQVNNWNQFRLDVNEDGSVHKTGSLFIEGVKEAVLL